MAGRYGRGEALAWPGLPGIGRVGAEEADALCVDVLVREAGGEAAVVASAGPTADEAVGRAEEHARRVLGGDWAMEDWRAC